MNPSIVSIGQAAALIQAMPSQIQQAAKSLNIEPAMKINMIDHYAEHDLQLIAEFLQKQRPRMSPLENVFRTIQ